MYDPPSMLGSDMGGYSWAEEHFPNSFISQAASTNDLQGLLTTSNGAGDQGNLPKNTDDFTQRFQNESMVASFSDDALEELYTLAATSAPPQHTGGGGSSGGYGAVTYGEIATTSGSVTHDSGTFRQQECANAKERDWQRQLAMERRRDTDIVKQRDELTQTLLSGSAEGDGFQRFHTQQGTVLPPPLEPPARHVLQPLVPTISLSEVPVGGVTREEDWPVLHELRHPLDNLPKWADPRDPPRHRTFGGDFPVHRLLGLDAENDIKRVNSPVCLRYARDGFFSSKFMLCKGFKDPVMNNHMECMRHYYVERHHGVEPTDAMLRDFDDTAIELDRVEQETKLRRLYEEKRLRQVADERRRTKREGSRLSVLMPSCSRSVKSKTNPLEGKPADYAEYLSQDGDARDEGVIQQGCKCTIQ